MMKIRKDTKIHMILLFLVYI